MNAPESDARPPFETQIEIDAPRDAVWEAVATDAGLRRWFAPDTSVDPRVGGEMLLKWGEFHVWKQTIVAYEPGTYLKTRYDSGVDDGEGGQRPLFVEFELSGEGGKTTLRLVQSGFGPESDFDEEYDAISSGWPVELRNLKLTLERHRGVDRQIAKVVARLSVAPDEAWRLLRSDEGLGCGNLSHLEEGAPFRFVTSEGDEFEGEAFRGGPREIAGIDRVRGDAFVRFSVETMGGPHAWLWVAGYGRPQEEMDTLQAHLEAIVDRLGIARAASQEAK